jgi:hypothetical protein
MSVFWQIESGLVRIESWGLCNAEEWKAALKGLLVHSDFHPGMGLVNDRRRLEMPPGVAAAIELRAAIAYIETRIVEIGRARWALVVADPVNFGMARMAQALLQGTQVELGVFYDPDEAEAWVRGKP